jgi:hypothetical protein
MLFDPYMYDLTTPANQPAQPEAALATDDLLAVPARLRGWLWQGLTRAVAGTLDLWECLPSGHQAAPPLFAVQHAGKRRFQPEALRALTLAGWHRLVGLELGLAAEALEVLALEASAIQQERLAEQCARVGQLYAEMERRAGEEVALALLRWELRMLRYRASPTLAPLIYADRPKSSSAGARVLQ